MASNPIDLQKLSSKLQTANKALGETNRPGDLVMKVGRIARPIWKIRGAARSEVAALMELTLNDAVFVERSHKAQPKDTLSWLYVYAQPKGVDQVIQGWVRSDGVLLDPPVPDAEVEFIPADTTMLKIVSKAFAEPMSGNLKRLGDDARFYVAALAYVNKTYFNKNYHSDGGLIFPKGWKDADFLKTDGWMDIGIKAHHAIWIPKWQSLQPLKGKFVSSGSFTHALLEDLSRGAIKLWEWTVGALAFACGLLHGATLAVYDALADVVELIQLIWKILFSSLLDLIKDAKKLWDTLTGIDWKAAMAGIADDFMAKWEADSTWARFYFQGEVVGYIIGMAILAFFTAGATAAAVLAAKGSKLARVLQVIMNNPVVKKVVENASVKKIVDKGKDALDKAKELQEKLAAWKKRMVDGALFKGLRLLRGYDIRMGIPEEHLKAMIDAAKETASIAIFRANKKAAIPLIRKGAHGKPMWAKFTSDKDTGVLTAKNPGEAYAANANGHFVMGADGKAYKIVNGKQEVMEVKNPFWEVKEGQVLAPDGKPIVGDYDLLGVAPVNSPGSNITVVPEDVAYGDWTGPSVEKYKAAVNKKGRLDEPRVLHGAQDGYGGNPKHMGLTNDTAYAVFPDGRTYIMEGRKAQQNFYDALGRQAKSPGAPVGTPDWDKAGDRVVR